MTEAPGPQAPRMQALWTYAVAAQGFRFPGFYQSTKLLGFRCWGVRLLGLRPLGLRLLRSKLLGFKIQGAKMLELKRLGARLLGA